MACNVEGCCTEICGDHCLKGIYAMEENFTNENKPMITELSESDAMTTYPLRYIMWSGRTQFSEVKIARSLTYGTMLFLDGELQSTSSDESIYHESLVHPVMAATQAKRVLVVGGGEGATVREVLRWNSVTEVFWVDIDVELVELCKEHLGWAKNVYTDPRVQFIGRDIKDVLPTAGLFDAIILDLPDPDGDTGFLYSEEFWVLIKACLRSEDSRVVTHTGPVKPSGLIGDGLQRVWVSANNSGIEPWISGFYQITIPSFQGAWGFWISGINTLIALKNPLQDAKVVDAEQLAQWAYPPIVWRTVLEAQRTTGYAFGSCNIRRLNP